MLKRFFATFSFVFFFFIVVAVFTAVYALELQESYVRLSSSTAQASPGAILVVATTTESVSEDAVRITVGSAWTIDSDPSSFTVSTANLPAGISQWPGMNTATAVSGQQITFPSSDLSSGTTYGFYITGGIPSNPTAGSSAAYLWNIATMVSSSVSSDSDNMVPVVSSSNVLVTGAVQALAYYFNADLTALTSGSTFSQGQEIEYEITYGSELLSSTALTVQAEWGLGTIEGSSNATTEVVEYVIGSAGAAFGSTTPVIDLVNRRITWTISSFPASTTDQKVRFKLRTTSNYTGSSNVSFTTRSRILSPATTSDSLVTKTYKYQAASPSPSPSPSPSVFPSSSPISSPVVAPVLDQVVPPSPTPFMQKVCNESCTAASECSTGYCYSVSRTCRLRENPTNSLCGEVRDVDPLSFEKIALQTITSSDAELVVTTNRRARLTVAYGTSQSQLTQRATFNEYSDYHLVSLTTLDAHTDYFFQITSIDELGQVITSDMLTIHTASEGGEESYQLIDVQAVSQNLPLLPQAYLSESTGKTTLPTVTPYEVFFTFMHSDLISDVYYYLEPMGVLGVQSDQPHRGVVESRVKLFESQMGTYSGRLESPSGVGAYAGYIEVHDIHGGIATIPVFELFISRPLLVVNATTQDPIERAATTFYRYNPSSQLYELIQEQTYVPSNPLYSDYLGQVKFVLPDGTYKAVLEAVGFEKQEVVFTIDADSLVEYPMVYLTPAKTSLGAWAGYHFQTAQSISDSIFSGVNAQLQSTSFKTLIELLSLVLFIALSFVSLTIRTKMSPRKLVSLLHFHSKHLLGGSGDLMLVHGQVVSESGAEPVSNASLLLFEAGTKQELAEVPCTASGGFFIQLQKPVSYIISAPGHIAKEGTIDFTGEETTLKIELASSDTLPQKVARGAYHAVTTVVGFLFEGILFTSFILEVLFISNLGFLPVFPFFALSVANLVLWFTYVSSHKIFS